MGCTYRDVDERDRAASALGRWELDHIHRGRVDVPVMRLEPREECLHLGGGHFIVQLTLSG